MPTRNEARKALNLAKIPQRDKYVFRSLAEVSDNKTLKIPDWAQPYRQSDQYVFGTSRANAQRALTHLRKHGWITWFPKQKAKQCGRPPNHYVLSIGTDCDCPTPAGREPVKPQVEAQPDPVKPQDDAPKSISYGSEFAVSPAETTKGVRDRGNEEEGRTFVPVWMLPRPAPDESWKAWPVGTIGYEVNAASDGRISR